MQMSSLRPSEHNLKPLAQTQVNRWMVEYGHLMVPPRTARELMVKVLEQ